MVLEFTASELADILKFPVSDLQHNRSLKGRLMQYSMYIFGRYEDCSGCRDAFKLQYEKLKKEGMAALEKKINRDFDLRPGYVAQLRFGSSIHISNAILTNELAIEFLSINKSRIKVFAKYPENWQSRVDAFLNAVPHAEKATPSIDEDAEVVAETELPNENETPEEPAAATEALKEDTAVKKAWKPKQNSKSKK